MLHISSGAKHLRESAYVNILIYCVYMKWYFCPDYSAFMVQGVLLRILEMVLMVTISSFFFFFFFFRASCYCVELCPDAAAVTCAGGPAAPGVCSAVRASGPAANAEHTSHHRICRAEGVRA